MKRAIAALLGAALITTSAARARADKPTADSCASAYEEAQRRQKKGALLDAREQAATCANAACPGEIVKFCSDLARDLDASVPTVVVAVTDAAGKSVSNARLVVDAKEPGVPLDGRPLPLDPGLHRLRVVPASSSDGAPADLEVTLLAGERNRRVEARLGAAEATRAKGEPPVPLAPVEPADRGGSRLPAAIALGGGGLGLAIGAVSGVLALSDESFLKSACKTSTSCPTSAQGRIDREKSFATASTIGFVAGGIAVATGVVLLVALGRSKSARITPSATGLAARF